jgi:hypothetical protein
MYLTSIHSFFKIFIYTLFNNADFLGVAMDMTI